MKWLVYIPQPNVPEVYPFYHTSDGDLCALSHSFTKSKILHLGGI